MVNFSNKPNMNGIKNTSNNIEYRSKLIGREGRLWMGLVNTRFSGFAIGMLLAIVLVLIIPALAKLGGL